ncbi:hypothetical protein [Aquirhabdus parva]|uniref:DUF4124 domain-containing protein n=1 Tax=Aquirhabdus parva TaxID=2283318 RepID=A0A345P701_9GAMM|nr:hypothetical protein [Aquirhabdus parva]AXI03060.1 hypothetical protein HYN46_09545 [Aquirhabdus parva]
MKYISIFLTSSLILSGYLINSAIAESYQGVYRCQNGNSTTFSDKACNSSGQRMNYMKIQQANTLNNAQPVYGQYKNNSQTYANTSYENNNYQNYRRPCPNVFEVTERYNKAIQDLRFNTMRNADQDYQKQELERLERNKQAELHGC